MTNLTWSMLKLAPINLYSLLKNSSTCNHVGSIIENEFICSKCLQKLRKNTNVNNNKSY